MREINEWNSRKDAERNAMTKDKTSKAFVGFFFPSLLFSKFIFIFRIYSVIRVRILV